VGKPEGKNNLEDPGVDGRIIVKGIFRNWNRGAWTGLIWIRIRKGAGFCKEGKELSGSMKCEEFID
jgi:hypothetical protein